MADTDEALGDVVIHSIELIAQASNALCHGCVLLARLSSRDSGFVVVSAVLDGKAPLVVQLHLAHGLGTPGAINLAGAGIPLLCSAVVFDTTSITDQIIARGLAITIVAGSQLDYTVALILGNALHGTQQVIEASVDALWGWCQGAGLAAARGHGAGRDGGGSRGRRGRRQLTRCTQRTRRAVRDNNARGHGRVVGILLERNFGGVDGGRGITKGRGRASSRVVLDDAVGGLGRGSRDWRAWWPCSGFILFLAGIAGVVQQSGCRRGRGHRGRCAIQTLLWCRLRFSRY
ncbi:hypothetical protein F5Y01DRAFT_147830 [Xylaria sp. FL0043]|nr:hypothetical protein F5Y01DRAFT_147830 [Xylaria sp. FL0043]